jgi:hypothetical protein
VADRELNRGTSLACLHWRKKGSNSMGRQFEDREWWDERKGRLCFEIDHEGRRIACCVDATCLFLAFGAKTLAEGDARDCYSANRRRIRELAIALAQKRPVRDSYLELTARDI